MESITQCYRGATQRLEPRKRIDMLLIKPIKRAIKPIWQSFTKPDHFRRILRRHYKATDDFFFVQIGANDGVSFDKLYDFVTTHACKGLVVEPLELYFERLKENYKDFPDIVPVKRAVHRTEKTALLHHVDPKKISQLPAWASGIGSMNPDHHKKSQTPSEHMIAEEVQCVHLMELLAQHHVDHIDLLQIDVEGYDAEVIRMIDFDLIPPHIIKYEHQVLSSADQNELTALLTRQGYRMFTQDFDTIAIRRSV